MRTPFRSLAAVLLGLGSLVAVGARAGAAELKGSVLLLAKGGKMVDRGADVRAAVVIWRPAAAPKSVATNRTFEMMTAQKEFVPRVLTVPVGASVVFPNSDPILHNVFSVSEGNRFDLGLYRKGPGKSWTFKTPGLVRVFCNVHHSMVAYIWVLDTPYSTQPDGTGAFTLANLPDGPGTLEVWHEQADATKLELKLPHADAVTLKLEVTKPRVPSHLNKSGQTYNQRGYSY